MDIQADLTSKALVKLLDGTALRQKVLTNNLANCDTPGYVRQDVNFEEQLSEAVRQQDFSKFKPTIQSDLSADPNLDGNNVSKENELAEMNKNALTHQLAIQLLQTRLSMERIAITGRA
jgi:flagellar basal-body rod protein FlgB